MSQQKQHLRINGLMDRLNLLAQRDQSNNESEVECSDVNVMDESNLSMRKKKFVKFQPNTSAPDACIQTNNILFGLDDDKKQKKIIQTLHLLSLPSARINQSESKMARRPSRQNFIPDSSRSDPQQKSFISEQTVIFHRPFKTKQVSLDQLKRKRPTYDRLIFKKKHGRINSGYFDNSEILNQLKPLSKETGITPQVYAQIVEVVERASRKSSFQAEKIDIEDDKPRCLKRITEDSVQYENPSKINKVCEHCGLQANSELKNKIAVMTVKYKALSTMIVGLKKQFVQLGESFLQLRTQFQEKINILQTNLKNQSLLQEFNIQNFRQIQKKCESIKKQHPSEMSAQCFEFVRNWQHDLEHEDDFSETSFERKGPIGNQGQMIMENKGENREKFSKKQSVKQLRNDTSMFSNRSAGKIIKNIKGVKTKYSKQLTHFPSVQFQNMEKFPLLAQLKQLDKNDLKTNIMTNSKVPQSPPTKQPQAKYFAQKRKQQMLILSQKIGKNGVQDPRLKQKQSNLKDSVHSLKAWTRKQSQDCYNNMQKALSQLKQSLL